MRDIEKTNMSHKASSRRIRRRKRGRSVYALLVVALAFAVIVVLSTTVFFNIREIVVTGDYVRYDEEEDIISAVGVSPGDNMMRLHLKELEEAAEETLIGAETVDIKRQFPDTLIVEVTKSIPAFNVRYEYGTLIVSRGGKILQDSMNPMEGLVSIAGYEPAETTPGKRLLAAEERHEKIFAAFQEIIDSGTLETPIVGVDMSDLNDIVVNFDNRIEFSMGNWSEIGYKINFAEQVIARQPEGKEGYLTMIGNNQCSFRNKSDVLNAEKRAAEQQAAAEIQPAEETLPETSSESIMPE